MMGGGEERIPSLHCMFRSIKYTQSPRFQETKIKFIIPSPKRGLRWHLTWGGGQGKRKKLFCNKVCYRAAESLHIYLYIKILKSMEKQEFGLFTRWLLKIKVYPPMGIKIQDIRMLLWGSSQTVHVIGKPLGHSIYIYPIITPLKSLKCSPSFRRRCFYTLTFQLVSEYRKQNPQGALKLMRPSSAFSLAFSRNFWDRKQFTEITHELL